MASKFAKRAPILQRLRYEWNHSLNSLSHSLCKQGLRTIVSNSIVSNEETIGNVDGMTVPELLKSNLHKWENDKAFSCAVTGKTYTHGEIFKKGRSFAAALMQMGLKRNDIVGIVLPNIPEYPIVCLGIWDAGLIPSPANVAYFPGEVSQQMSSCKAKAIVTISEIASGESLKTVSDSCPDMKSIIVIGESRKDCHSFYEMIKVGTIGINFLKGSDISDDDVAVIPYSSGTSGPPKGVMLTHKTILSNLLQISSPDFHALDFNEGGSSQERIIAVLPFFHIYGFNVLMASTLYQGHSLSCLPKFQPRMFENTLKKHKPTYMHLVTPLIGFMVANPEIGKKETACVRTFGAGAAPLGLALIEQALEKFGNHIFIQEGYGMTELSPCCHIVRQSTKNTKLGSIGSILPGTQCKVVSVENGKTVGHNQRGELCIKGPQIMKGYFQNEKATKETIDSEGWLHTGDIGYYDNDECFFIVDRIKELIKVKGFQVAPAELEDLLREHPGVADVAIIGVPDDRTGELPRAYVVKKSNHPVSENELKDFVAQRLVKYKQLEGGVEFIDAIPKATTGKILRRELKENFIKGQKK